MKRKGSKKSQKPEDDSNGVEDQTEENGGASEEVDETEESEEEKQPQEKKRRSSKPNKKNVSFSKKGDDNEEDDFDEEPQEKKKKSKSKKNKKAKEPKSESEAENDDDQDEDDEAQYEVEKVLDDKMIRGVRHYLIRWKGYEEESDTWEPEDTLSCQDLIKAFKEGKKKPEKAQKGVKGRKPVTKHMEPGEEWDENEDFEVDKILEVHFKKGGKREFLVVWKGYGLKDSSWEPEENMNCKDLIEKFMARVEVAKNYEDKELRVNRKHVQRLTYNTPDSNRRLSKRNSNRERVQYHDAE